MANDYRFVDPSRDQIITDSATGAVLGIRSRISGSGTASLLPLQLTGGTMTGILYVTIAGTPATLTQPTVQATNSVDNYTQVSIQNKSATANSSADLIAYPDNVAASDLTGFMDMGMTSSAFSQAAYAITGQNEGYLFCSAPTASGKTGSMIIATDATGTANDIIIGVNGFNALANQLVFIKGAGANARTVGIGATPTGASAILELTSTTKGFKPPVMTTTQKNAISSPAEGLLVYDSTLHKLSIRTAAAWETITSA
jgi:hypothetical protein